MTDIKFARDYGMPPASPLWFVYSPEAPGHSDHLLEPAALQSTAEQRAADLAQSMPGTTFHVLAVMSTIHTSAEVVGLRFDPTRAAPVAAEPEPAPVPEFAEVDEVPLPAPDVDEFGDDKPL